MNNPAQVAPKIPAHPLGLKCSTCVYWNKAMSQEVILLPNGQAVPVAVAAQMGMPTITAAKVKAGVCQYMPKWENTLSDAYCWQHKSIPKFGAAND